MSATLRYMSMSRPEYSRARHTQPARIKTTVVAQREVRVAAAILARNKSEGHPANRSQSPDIDVRHIRPERTPVASWQSPTREVLSRYKSRCSRRGIGKSNPIAMAGYFQPHKGRVKVRPNQSAYDSRAWNLPRHSTGRDRK